MMVLLVAAMGTHHEKPAATPAMPSFHQEQLDGMAALIRVAGYSCKTPIGARNMLVSQGFVVHCQGDRPNAEYWFDVEDRGGHWTVTPR
jgi:hypothetical protein